MKMHTVVIGLVFLFITFSVNGQVAPTFPPGIDPANELVQLGFLDVTLYGADTSGATNSTAAIRQAIRDARDHQLVCWFPSGTYLVSDSISCVLPVTFDGIRWRSDRRKPPVLMGAYPRPLLKLESGASGFDDPMNPKPVLWCWSERRDEKPGQPAGSSDPSHEQSNIAFNMTIKGIDIDLNGNAGAAGIKFSGAQGSTVEDVSIDATGAFAGLYNCVGQGGGTYNVQVKGGRYGIYIDDPDNAKFAVYAGCRFLDQDSSWLSFNDFYTQMVVVGFHIRKEGGLINDDIPFKGLSMLDGVIEITGPASTVPTINHATNRNLYLKNVFFKGNSSLVLGVDMVDPSVWTHINEYAWSRNFGSNNLIDGVLTTGAFIEFGTDSPDINNLIEKHVWDESSFPSISNRNAATFVNVKDSAQMGGVPAVGDGVADDTDALLYAIDNFTTVFLPRGIYKVSAPIRLKFNTQLFGAGKTFSIIRPDTSWQPADRTAVVETIYNKDAKASLSFLMIETSNAHHYMMNHLSWRIGAASIVRDIMAGSTSALPYYPPARHHHTYEVTHFGGGKWYGVAAEWTRNRTITHHPDYRGVWVSGTTEPFAIYGLNVERVDASPMVEIENSSNVDIFYFKAESGTEVGIFSSLNKSVCLRIENSAAISLHASTGNIQLDAGKGVVEVENSEDIRISSIKGFDSGSDWNSIKETKGSEVFEIPADDHVSFFFRGADSCATTAGLLATPLSSNTVKLQWNSIHNADLYQLTGEEAVSGNGGKAVSTSNTKTISGLTSGNSYLWKVRLRCLNGAVSSFSQPDTFTMPLMHTPLIYPPNIYSDGERIFVNSPDELVTNARLYNLHGAICWECKGSFHSLTTEPLSLPHGCYLLTITNNSGIFSKKIWLKN